jgi:hypothetical protein
MSNEVRSSSPLRFLIVESTTQLRQQPTRLLPDGSQAYIPSAGASYRLVKDVGTAFDTLNSVILIPGDQSNNRWFRESAAGASPWSGVEVATADNTLAATGAGVWRALGATPGAFTLATGDSAMFAVNATSSLLTYHGLTREVLVTAVVEAFSVGIADVIRAVISHDNDVAIGSSADEHLKGEMGSDTASGASACITTQRFVTLLDGDTLRLMLRSLVGGADMTVRRFSLSVIPR